MSINGSQADGESFERDQAEQARAQRLFSFLESMPVGIFVVDAAGKPIYANDLAKSLRGPGIDPSAPTPPGTEPIPVYTAYVAGTDQRYPYGRMPIIRALAGETSMVEDMEVERPDGRIELQVWGAPIRGERGEITYAVTAFNNITGQRRFERALQESESLFRHVFEESPLGMAIISPDLEVLRVNQALCTMTGYAADEMLGQPFHWITHPADSELTSAGNAALLRGEYPVSGVELRYVHKDGQTVWVRITVRQVPHSATGEVAFHLATVLDITAEREERGAGIPSSARRIA